MPNVMADEFMRRCAEYVKAHREELDKNPTDNFVQRIMKEVIDEFSSNES